MSALPAMIDGVARALKEARTLDQVVVVRDRAKALQRMTKGVASARDAHNRCGEIVIYALRREGEELAKLDKQDGGDAMKARFRPGTEVPPTLAELGISKKEASVAQQLAAVPESEMQIYIAEAKESGNEVTTAGALRSARRTENDAQRAAAAAQPVQMPTGRYESIVIDPPWDMEKIEREVRPNQIGFDYPTMTEDELAALDVASMAADDCHLFCWTTHRFLPMALRLLEPWGFRYVLTMVWHKAGGFQPIGLPQYNCEFVIYARRGSPKFIDTKDFFACFEAPRREHSRKPDEFYNVIRRVTAGPRIDVFSREPREGFAQHGNEAAKFAEAS